MGNAASFGLCSKQIAIKADISLEKYKQSLEKCEYSKEKREHPKHDIKQPKEIREQMIEDNEQPKEKTEQTIEYNEKFIKENKQNKGRLDEKQIGNKPIPLDICIKLRESICKIIIKNRENIIYGSGFFMKISKSLKFLFTNWHIINKELINDNNNIEIEIWNKEKMKINLNQRYIKYFEKPKDITIIEIKEEDKIYKDIKFLEYDSNYKEKGYKIYKGVDVFTLEHPSGGDVSSASGKILYIDNIEFVHNVPTDTGSSGCPIILLNNNINLVFVIGIHKSKIINSSINNGTFIGEIINEFKIDSNFFPKIKKDKKDKEEKEDLMKAKANIIKISEDKSNTINLKYLLKKKKLIKMKVNQMLLRLLKMIEMKKQED